VKVHVVACFELKRPASLVGIAFLAISGSFQVGMEAVDYFFSLNDKVRTKNCPLTKLNPVHRCTAMMAIQRFERCHPETLLIIVVVRELSQGQTLVPFVLVVQYTTSDHILQNLIYPLCLTICLRMIS
jgi:hypothetical protein